MSDAKTAADLPDRFIEMVDSMYMPLELTLYNRRGENNWDIFRLRDYEWDYHDNVGDATAIEAFNTGNVYAKVKR